MTDSRQPILVINPRSDAAFRAAVDERARGASTPAELQARLRVTYPIATVRPRELSGEPDPVWYVYRDGRWIAPGDQGGG